MSPIAYALGVLVSNKDSYDPSAALSELKSTSVKSSGGSLVDPSDDDDSSYDSSSSS